MYLEESMMYPGPHVVTKMTVKRGIVRTNIIHHVSACPTHSRALHHDSGSGLMPSLRVALQANLLAGMTGRGSHPSNNATRQSGPWASPERRFHPVRKYTSTQVSDKHAR